MNDPPPPAVSNPFRTRRIRPGAIPYVFPAGEDADRFLQRLKENGWRGEIVGPHGSGKSSLLAALMPLVEKSGRDVLHIELHDGSRRLPISPRTAVASGASTLIVVDGYEQLGHLARWRLRWFCRCRKLGLLVTAHAPVGLPPLFDTTGNVRLAERIVEWLTSEVDTSVTRSQLDECIRRNGPNLRETLFDLYDLHEQTVARR